MKGSFAQTLVGQTMNLDLSKTVGGPRDVTTLCTDLFLIVIRMREAEDLGDPGALRKLIGYYLDLFEKNCAAISMPRESIEDAKYAIVALIDETVLSSEGACRDFWLSHPLQLDYFGDNVAGEGFYNRLEKMQMQFDKKKDVLEVFYICLSLGFEGKFKISNAELRAEIMDGLGQKLRKMRIRVSAGISPHAYHQGEALTKKDAGGSRAPAPLWAIAAAGGALVAVWYIVWYIVNSTQAGRLIQILQPLSAR